MTPRTTFAGPSPFVGLQQWKAAQAPVEPIRSRRITGPTVAEQISMWLIDHPRSIMVQIAAGTKLGFETVQAEVMKMMRFGELDRAQIDVSAASTDAVKLIYSYTLTGKSTRYKLNPKSNRKLSDAQVAEVVSSRKKGMHMAQIAHRYSVTEDVIRAALRGTGAYRSAQ